MNTKLYLPLKQKGRAQAGLMSAPPDFPTALYHALHHRLVPGADALSPA